MPQQLLHAWYEQWEEEWQDGSSCCRRHGLSWASKRFRKLLMQPTPFVCASIPRLRLNLPAGGGTKGSSKN
eukprot:4479397-Pleurochrysis_carterae.AAC.2